MTSPSTRLILVDTNCFLRLYHSPVLPLMGQDIGGYQLVTLECLVNEFLDSPNLTQSYPWVDSEPTRSDLINAKLNLRGATKTAISTTKSSLAPYAKSLLELHCKRKAITPRSLSGRDLELLAASIVLKGVLATDEWPLRHVAQDLMEDQDECQIGLFDSLELLHLLETNERLRPDERRKTVQSWIRYDEKLLRGWQNNYLRLFGESYSPGVGV